MKISEASRHSGLSIDTIRFYERSGLIPTIDRDDGGRRQFSEECLDWLKLIASLRETGMPVTTMRKFASLYRKGNATIPARRAVLLAHAATLDRQREKLDHCAALLSHKLKRYSEIEEQ